MSDADTAEAMLDLAEAFLMIQETIGDPYSWEAGEAARLDGLCDDYVATARTRWDRSLRGLTATMGAYLGELLVRHGDGRWKYDTERREATVELANDLETWPMSRVAKRLRYGREYNLFHYFQYALTGEPPPGTTVRTTDERGKTAQTRHE